MIMQRFALVSAQNKVLKTSRNKEHLEIANKPLFPGSFVAPVEPVDHGPTRRVVGDMDMVYDPSRRVVVQSWPTIAKTQAELDADARSRGRVAIGDPHELMMKLYEAMEAGELPKVTGFHDVIAAAKATAAIA